jgi:polar amino acid transport system substrate-binding protein
MSVLFILLLFATTDTPLKVGVVESTPLSFKANGEYQGYCVDVLKSIGQDLGKQFELVPVEIGTAFDLVASGDIDMVIGGISMTADREAKIDFTHPIYLDGGLSIVSREDSSFGLSRDAWKAIWIFIPYLFISAFIYWLVERKHSLPSGIKAAFWPAIWFIDALFSTRGWGDIVPKTNLGKFVALAIGMVGLVMYSYFNSFVTVRSLEKNTALSSIEELQGKTVYTKANTTADDFLKFSGISYKKCLTIEEAYVKILSNEADAVVFDTPSALYFAKNNPGVVVGGTIHREAYAFIINDNDQKLAESVNISILRLRQSGELAKIARSWFGLIK